MLAPKIPQTNPNKMNIVLFILVYHLLDQELYSTS
jgi:hypothetical protein